MFTQVIIVYLKIIILIIQNNFKKIFKNDIPNHIYQKPKIGFNAPLNYWKNENVNYFRKNFSENSFYDYFFKKNFNKEDFLYRKEYTGLLFSLIVFDKWLISNHE